MRILVVLVCGVIAVNAAPKGLTKEFMQEVQKVGLECLKESKASHSDLGELMKHNIPTNHAGQCLLFCFHKYYKIQNEDGSINLEGARDSLEKLKIADADLHEKMLKILDTCAASAVIESDPCVTAAGMGNCAVTEGKKMGITPDMLEI